MDMTAAGHRQWRAGLRGGEITVAGSAMLLPSAVAACLVVFMLMLGTPSLAQAAACDQLFAGGQAPALLNARLAQAHHSPLQQCLCRACLRRHTRPALVRRASDRR